MYVVCKYFLPICSFSFLSLTRIFYRENFSSWLNQIMFSFPRSYILMLSKKCLPYSRSWRVFLSFHSKIFIILSFTLYHMIQSFSFLVLFVCFVFNKVWVLKPIFLVCGCSISPAQFAEMSISSTLNCFCSFVKEH